MSKWKAKTGMSYFLKFNYLNIQDKGFTVQDIARCRSIVFYRINSCSFCLTDLLVYKIEACQREKYVQDHSTAS